MYQVYKHTCPNQKVYIGMTGIELDRRWRNGFGYEKNKAFFHDIVKYGWDNIKHEVLTQHETQDEALREEAYQIFLHKAIDAQYGYNFAQNGSTHSAPVAQYTKDGRHIGTFNSIKEAAQATGVNESTICLCCKGKSGTTRRKSAGGYVWRYANEVG